MRASRRCAGSSATRGSSLRWRRRLPTRAGALARSTRRSPALTDLVFAAPDVARDRRSCRGRAARGSAHRRAGARARSCSTRASPSSTCRPTSGSRTRRLRGVVRRRRTRRRSCCRGGLRAARARPLAACPARGSSRAPAAIRPRPSRRASRRSKRASAIGTRVVVDAKSGVSGAGRSRLGGTHYCASTRRVAPYKVGSAPAHARDGAGAVARRPGATSRVIFAPHLVPMTRGLLSTVYLDVEEGFTTERGRRALPRPLPRRAVRARSRRGRDAVDRRGPRHEPRRDRRVGRRAHQHARRRVRDRQPRQGCRRPGDPVPQRGSRVSRDRGPRRCPGRWSRWRGARASTGFALRRGRRGRRRGLRRAAGVHCGLKAEGRARPRARGRAEESRARRRRLHHERGRRRAGASSRASTSTAGRCRAVVINAGNANACTGAAGLSATRDAWRAAVAEALGCAPDRGHRLLDGRHRRAAAGREASLPGSRRRSRRSTARRATRPPRRS